MSGRYIPNSPQASARVEQSLGDVIRFLRRRWPIIVGTAVAFAIVASLILLQATPRFTAESSVAILADKQVVQAGPEANGNNNVNDAMIATQVSILRSTKLMGLLIDQLKLDQDPEFNASLAKTSFSLLRPTTWFGSDDAAIAPKLTPKQQLEKRARIINAVTGAFGITAEPRSYVIDIRATSKDPIKAVKMANVLADLYIRDGIRTELVHPALQIDRCPP